MSGIRFNNIHSYDDLGLTLSTFTISPPTPKTYKVKIAGTDGDIDLTEALSGDIKYENRTITLKFAMLGDGRDIQDKYSEVMNALHGKRFSEIVFDDDGNYHYIGRVSAIALGAEPLIGTINIQCIVEPYKYDWGDDWLWDPFNFQTGIINEVSSLKVNGILEVTYIGQRKKYIPYITTNAEMTVVFSGTTYQLIPGKNKIFEIEFQEGPNILTFQGNGIVTIENKGGSL
ncbi:MAG: hypothetical protein J6D08_09850 [Lachnospiraceae bacterium]|nr:hypothetical protein [Lachnospiraceae bacterium]